ncbi:MAG: putative sensor domain DACNV-containing protein, partial [Longimicrobiaceae bacterium]
RAPRISLAWVPPGCGPHAMVFERALDADPRGLARVAPAVERPGIHLGACRGDDGALCIWGTSRSVPQLAIVVEVVEPGLLVLKQRRGDEHDKFGTIAVLAGDRVQVVDEGGASLPDCPGLLAQMLGFGTPAPADGSVNVLIQLAVSMRAHGRGGSLLVVPADSDEWRASAAQPIPYLVQPYAGLAELLGAADEEQARPAWREALHRAVEAVAGLTAVDGATVLNTRDELLAFGVKLARRRGSERVERVAVTAPVVGNAPEVVDPSQLGGTRHLSAAQFVHDQRDALALVASQDGRFTVFAWSPCEGMVHAHRVETLLM